MRETRPELDEVTLGLVATAPMLVAKLLCVDGLRGYVHGSSGVMPEGLTPDQRTLREGWLATQAMVERVEEVVAAHVESTGMGEEVARAAFRWRNGFPPHAIDFTADEHAALDAHDASPFVQLVRPLVPVDVVDVMGVTQ